MGPLVPDKVALLGEPPRADRASVGLLARVGPLVLGCFAVRIKLRGAEGAMKGGAGVAGGVDPLVPRQLGGTPEPLLAVPT